MFKVVYSAKSYSHVHQQSAQLIQTLTISTNIFNVRSQLFFKKAFYMLSCLTLPVDRTYTIEINITEIKFFQDFQNLW